MPDAVHTIAAVVKPEMTSPLRRKITPAPRNPTPLTICADKRIGSERIKGLSYSINAVSIEIIVNKQLVTAITTHVFSPSGLCLASRSIPSTTPATAAINNFTNQGDITSSPLLHIISLLCHTKMVYNIFIQINDRIFTVTLE